MAGRSRSTFGKRQKEAKRQEKRQEKAARRDQRKLERQSGVSSGGEIGAPHAFVEDSSDTQPGDDE